MAFVAAATFATISISSCKDDDDDNKSNNKFVFDESRPHGGPVDQMSGANSDQFYNGFTNNESNSIVIDTRPASEYAAGHVRGAISHPLVNDDAFYYDDDPIYSKIESLDPNKSKIILFTDNGASTLMLHVAGRISAMGWGQKKVYLLMDKTVDFLKKYPAVKQ